MSADKKIESCQSGSEGKKRCPESAVEERRIPLNLTSSVLNCPFRVAPGWEPTKFDAAKEALEREQKED